MKKILAPLFIILFIQQFVLAGQNQEQNKAQNQNLKEKRRYTTHPINPEAPMIDGRLDEPVWEKAELAGGFIQQRPNEGKEPSQQTGFKILYDDKNLYIGIHAYDTEPDKVERRMSRRDNLEGDWVCVQIDSYFDQRTAFSFMVNAAGVKGDGFISNNGENEDENWDPIWYVKTSVDDKGWTAEMRIPLSQLRFGRKENQVWGLQVLRSLFRKEEHSFWQFIPQDSSGWVHEFGELHGLNDIKSSRQVELYPYAVSDLQRFKQEPGNPFATGRSSQMRGGLDGKLGVTSDLTLDFTINPDFGQVEADPSVVNLTAFETYYQEKRPFFIEGRNILHFRIMMGDGDFSSDTLFYSRRVGRGPQRTLNGGEGEFIDTPQSTSILGAFKLTGKTRTGLSIGVIDSVTAEETADISSQGEMRSETVEPLTNYFGFRIQKDYSKGNTILGAMVTAANRDISNPALDFLHDGAYAGGVDFYHTWKNKTYYISANTVFSYVHGPAEALLRTQMSPLRYFQRPDADHVSLDPARTSLAGHGGTVVGGKQGSGHFQYVAGVTWRSPGLELNDMGYQRYADKTMEFVWAGYRVWKPFSIFRSINVGFNQWKGWDFSGANIFDGGNMYFNADFKNYWCLGLGINRQGQSLSSSALRGGPSLRWPGGWNTWGWVESNTTKKLRFELSMSNFSRDENKTSMTSLYLGMSYNPTKALSFSVGPSLSLNNDQMQYVCQKNFGQEMRYIFARIEQKTFALTMRLNFSLTPDLSIQYYGQPFISAGDYTDFKRITQPRAEAYEDRYHQFSSDELNYDGGSGLFSVDENRDGTADYNLANPNFNFFEFRSNLVVRWEYKPGSVLYLVWSQGRTGFSPTGEFSLMSDMRNLFDVYPHNIFLVKFSYGFNL